MGFVVNSATHDLRQIDWASGLSTAGYAALLVVLTAVAGLKVGPGNGTASFLPSVVAKPKPRARRPRPTSPK